MTSLPVVVLLTLLAPASPSRPGPAPRLDAWEVVGPGGGGTMRRPAVSPHDPRVVVLGCDMTGSYITRDGGQSFRMFQLGWVAEAFTFDPANANVIYAASKALWRSEDGGVSWAMVFPDPARNTKEHGWGDHADVIFTTDDPMYPSGLDTTLHAVAIDPGDPQRLFLALSARTPGPPGSSAPGHTLLLQSHDRGRTWARLHELSAERVFALHVDEGPPRMLRVAAETAIYEGWDATWQRLPLPDGRKIQSASFGRDAASGRTLLYTTTALEPRPGGLYVSEDGGRHWRSALAGLTGLVPDGSGTGKTWGPAAESQPLLGPVAASARHGLTAYVGLRGLRETPGSAAFNGIARTTDGGRTWRVVHAEADRPSANLDPSWIEARAAEDGGSVWFDAPYDLAVAPGSPEIAYATDLFRTYRTEDGGRTWAQVNSARRERVHEVDSWTSRGLDVTNAYGVHWDPFDPSRVFLSNTDIGLFRSEDGGASWTGSTTGVPRAWRNTTYWIAFDPEVRGLVWGAFSGTHDLPRPKMWRRTDPAHFKGGVGVSTDGGRTWSPAGRGLPEAAITHVLLDPTSPPGRRTLFATAYGHGVFKSTDNGHTWSAANAGITQRQPFAWRLSRATDGTLYLVVARRSERGRIGDKDDGALYVSVNGGGRWEPVVLPPGTNGPNGLTVDPQDARRLYLAAWGVARPGGDTGGGIFLSSDRGATWSHVLAEAQHVYDVTVDPRDGAVLYASGFDRGVYRSPDRGATWSRLRGFNFKWGQRVVPDPKDASRIYVTTFGGGVWHGPAQGAPGSAEDRVGAESDRLDQLVRANIVGVHAFQMKLARATGRGAPACWPADTSEGTLDALVAHQAALLAADLKDVRAWAEGRASAFDPTRDLEPLLQAPLSLDPRLPVNVYAAWLAARVPSRPRAHGRAVANLYQTVLEVERDGLLLQDLIRFYIGLGLPVHVGAFGLPGSDDDFLAVGRELAGRSCDAPVGLSAEEWQIAGRKIWNWGEKRLGIRDARVLAGELAQEPDVQALLPRLRALPAQRVAVVGHSFTMDLHWSSPSAFVPIVTALLRRENPRLEVRQFEGGGLTASRAENRFYDDLLAWKPDVVLFVVANRTDLDLESFARMGRGLRAAGAQVFAFDDVKDPDTSDPARLRREWEVARSAGISIVEVSSVLAASPLRGRFFSLDKIHMTEPYHRLMAREWLKVLVGGALRSRGGGS